MEKFIEKLLTDTFKDISDRNWISTLYWYVIDSKERTQKRLDSFLKEQIDNPDQEVLNLARSFAKYKDSDKIIIEILKYVKNKLTYKSDSANFGKVEYWATTKETLFGGNNFADCDDYNSTIYVLFRLASAEIIDNYLYCCIGDVIMPDGSTTGHYWLVYMSPKTGKWYPIDGTYYQDLREIGQG